MKIGVVRERVSGERRVALVPDAVAKLIGASHQLFVERGAGAAAGYLDSAYEKAGATIVADVAALSAAAPQLVVKVRKPRDRKSTRLNSSHIPLSRMPSSA